MKGSTWWAESVPPELGDGYVQAIIKAIRGGHAYITWTTVELGDLTFEICNPIGIGTFEDHVLLFGLSAEAVDLIALELGDVMSPTPALWDAAAEDDRQVPIGPHTQPNGARGMRKEAAKQHSDEIQADGVPPRGLISAACKTYVLNRYRPPPGPAVREHFACEYGWRLPSPVSWGSPNASRTGWVVQPPQWAHFYRAFWDYSMGGIYVKKAATLHGKPVSLADVLADGSTAGVGSLSGPVPFIIHPEHPGAVAGLSSPGNDEPPDTEPSPGSGPILVSQPTIRLGDRGGPVGVWQAALIAAGFSLAPFGVDEHFGRLTHDMTRRYQRAHKLTPDGIVGPKTWSTVGDERTAPFPTVITPLQASPFPPLRGTAARQAVFGSFAFEPAPSASNPEAIRITDGWIQDNITKIHIPQLRGVRGAPRDGGIYFHKLAIDQLIGLFRAWEEAGLSDRVLSWAGSWVPRFIRGSRSVLSNHAFGSAFDINAAWNPLGATPADVGERGSVVELVPLAHKFGFYWGGHFGSRPDGMHFEVGKVSS